MSVRTAAPPPMVERLPPHDLEAEMAVLGCVFLEPLALQWVRSILDPADFYRGWHQRIYAACLRCDDGKVLPDVIAVRNALEQQGELGRAGGVEYLATIGTAVSSPANAKHYAGIVAAKARARRHIASLSTALQDLYEGQDPGEVERRVAHAIEETSKPAASGVADPITMADLSVAEAEAEEYVWKGYVAPGCVSILAGHPKAGKSYLTYALVAALERGAPFCGRATRKTRTLILSEEPRSSLREKRDRFQVESALVYPRAHAFPRRPFRDVVLEAADACGQHGAGLLVIDTWAFWASLGPDAEKDAGATQAALEPVQEAASRGLAVLLTHHLRKADGEEGTGLRGSGALAAAVEFILELRRAKGGGIAAKRRVLNAMSRFESTPAELVLELDGSTYRCLGDAAQAKAEDLAERVLEFLRRRPWQSVDTLKDVLRARKSSILAHLAEGLAAGVFDRVGQGSKVSPYLYAGHGTERPSDA